MLLLEMIKEMRDWSISAEEHEIELQSKLSIIQFTIIPRY